MDPMVIAFEVLCCVTFVAVVTYFAIQSARHRRVHPGIWLSLAIFSISWMEAPYDRAMFVQFHPDFHRLPAWGPLAATQGGLPLIMPAGYVMYFLLPAMFAVSLADRMARRWALHRGPTLIAVGICVGVCFDAIMQFGQSQLASPLWVFSHTASYVTAFPGTQRQIPLYDLLAMGSMIMWLTYLLGSKDRRGQTFVERWADRVAVRPAARLLLTAVGYIVVVHLLYLYVMLPHLILWWGQMLTQTGVVQPFSSIPAQPASVQSHGAIGAAFIVIWLVCGIVGSYIFAGRRDARAFVASTAALMSRPAGASGPG